MSDIFVVKMAETYFQILEQPEKLYRVLSRKEYRDEETGVVVASCLSPCGGGHIIFVRGVEKNRDMDIVPAITLSVPLKIVNEVFKRMCHHFDIEYVTNFERRVEL